MVTQSNVHELDSKIKAVHTREERKRTQDDHVAAVRLPNRGTARTPRVADRVYHRRKDAPRYINKTQFSTLR